MIRILFFLSALIVFAVINVSIYHNEILKEEGEKVFLKLAPVDPRSLMQGDYMRLRYEVETQIKRDTIPKQRSGQIIIECIKECSFVDFYSNQELASNQYLMNARFLKYAVHIKPDSFLFQEGLAELYSDAKYGVFVFGQDNQYLLVDLANENKQVIGPLKVN